jgi:uncharacterized membrane protein YfcA
MLKEDSPDQVLVDNGDRLPVVGWLFLTMIVIGILYVVLPLMDMQRTSVAVIGCAVALITARYQWRVGQKKWELAMPMACGFLFLIGLVGSIEHWHVYLNW